MGVIAVWVKPVKPYCLMISIFFAYVFFLLGLGMLFASLLDPARIAHYKEWMKPASWEPRSCRVLQSGVSNRGACPTGDYSDVGVPGHFLKYTECPGWDFCAQEDQPCKCTGDVMLSHGKYGLQYVPDMKQGHHEIIQNVAGTTQCSLEVFGSDPMPGSQKACWCLRQAVAEEWNRAGAEAAQCLNIANKGYEAAVKFVDNGISSLVEERSNDGVRGAENNTDADFFVGGANAMAGANSGLSLLEIGHGHYTPPHYKGSGGCSPSVKVYLPWVMVEVINDQDPTVKSLRCAYTYGADAVSRVHTAAEAWPIYQRYESAIGSEISCEVHDDCTVATENLQSLLSDEQKDHDESVRQFQVWTISAFCMMVCVSCLARAGFFFETGKEMDMSKGQVFYTASKLWVYVCAFYGIPLCLLCPFQINFLIFGLSIIGGLVLFMGIPMCISPFTVEEMCYSGPEPMSEPLL